MALMLSGIALFQEEKFKDASVKWEKLLTMMDPESPDAEQMRANIAETRSKAGLPTMESNQLPPVPAAAAAGMTPEKINDMVNRLAERLKANPGDLPGWARLARAYKVQGRLEEAEQAYARTGKLLDTDADLVAQYADLLATRANGNFKGKPAQLITTGLKLNPRHPMLLMMAGQAALQRQDFAAAIGHWETVLTVLPAGSPDSEQVKTEIASARAKMK
jgi:cytochrome c-type biogenesis protein CcmH